MPVSSKQTVVLESPILSLSNKSSSQSFCSPLESPSKKEVDSGALLNSVISSHVLNKSIKLSLLAFIKQTILSGKLIFWDLQAIFNSLQQFLKFASTTSLSCLYLSHTSHQTASCTGMNSFFPIQKDSIFALLTFSILRIKSLFLGFPFPPKLFLYSSTFCK